MKKAFSLIISLLILTIVGVLILLVLKRFLPSSSSQNVVSSTSESSEKNSNSPPAIFPQKNIRSSEVLTVNSKEYTVELFSDDETVETVKDEEVYCGSPTAGTTKYKGNYRVWAKDSNEAVNLDTQLFVENTLHDGKLVKDAIEGNSVLILYSYASCAAENVFIFGIDATTQKLKLYTFAAKDGAISKQTRLSLKALGKTRTLPVNVQGNLVTVSTDYEKNMEITTIWHLNTSKGSFDEISTTELPTASE